MRSQPCELGVLFLLNNWLNAVDIAPIDSERVERKRRQTQWRKNKSLCFRQEQFEQFGVGQGKNPDDEDDDDDDDDVNPVIGMYYYSVIFY